MVIVCDKFGKEGVVKTCDGGDYGEVIEKREVSANNQKNLFK
jgi:hypothetical protein